MGGRKAKKRLPIWYNNPNHPTEDEESVQELIALAIEDQKSSAYRYKRARENMSRRHGFFEKIDTFMDKDLVIAWQRMAAGASLRSRLALFAIIDYNSGGNTDD